MISSSVPLTDEIQHQIDSIFPVAASIPDRVRLQVPMAQRQYLIDGELRVWEGAVETVPSPIHIQSEEGLKPVIVGHFFSLRTLSCDLL